MNKHPNYNYSIMSESVGNKIKNLREAANLSLEAMANSIGINTTQLSLIESNEVSPTISMLMKISRVFGTRLGTILDGTEESGPVVSTHSQMQPTISNSNDSTELREHMDFYSLAKNKSDRNMDPLIIDVEYLENLDNMSNHEGEEFIYVLDGEVKVTYGTDTYTLKKGDSIYYDSIVPHIITTSSASQKAKVLAVIYTPF